MTKRTVFSLGLSALVLGSMMAGSAIGGDAARGSPADHARAAAKALGKHQSDAAIAEAEAAVSDAPQVAGYRTLLGRSYLQAGRFQSARQAFTDALALEPGDGATALNLALMQIATGSWRDARITLNTHADMIALADRGLATALAGDPATGVQLLTQAARADGAGATVRQNLALALALSGQWQMARAAAAADLSPADVDARLQQWATFAQPRTAADQVATLLGVREAADTGQPYALALIAPVAMGGVRPDIVAAAPAPAMPAAEPVVKVVAMVPAADPLPTPVLVPVAVPSAASGGVVFGPRREVVQALPAPPTMLIRADARPAKVSLAQILRDRPARVLPNGGEWYVQLGAFGNPGVARDAWGRMSRRFTAFHGHVPQAMNFRTASASFYRLSIGGFDRAAAVSLCGRYRAQGGACFVRRGAGDQMAQWFRRPATLLAAR